MGVTIVVRTSLFESLHSKLELRDTRLNGLSVSSTNLSEGSVIEVSNKSATFMSLSSAVVRADVSGFFLVARDGTDDVDISGGSLLND